ncbi:hypothetical protein [Pseudomonas sp. RC10]|uniref:hypothetical protein n=1 Tax=Pseudomonas bambusae TaxID=3139142 RepID=UPI003139A851
MHNKTESVYSQTLVAVFEAALALGIDTQMLALQTKLEINGYDEWLPLDLRHNASRIIDESVAVAKILFVNKS